jgi:two-component system response regulator AtoC
MRGREASFSQAALHALRSHRWPGNVRELENSIERACIVADAAELKPADLGLIADGARDATALGFDVSGSLNEAVERAVKIVERQKIAAALAEHDGNKSRTAESLEVSYKTLLTKIKEYNL